MIEKLKVFDYEIIRHKVPIDLYNDAALMEDVNKVFAKEEVVAKGNRSPEKVGEGYSTAGMGERYVTNLKNISPLLNYVSKLILNSYYEEKNYNRKILFTRMWMNKIYKNCSGKCHVHYSGNDLSGTAILYFKAPKNGSKLIILKEDIGDEKVTEIHKNISHYIEVEDGDLIIHNQNVPHAFSKHLSDNPRTCLVLDFELKSESTRDNLKNKFICGKYI